MKFVLMHFIRSDKPTAVTVADVPQMDTDEEMIEYVSETEKFGKYLRLFERVDRFEVVERDWPSPYKANSIMKMNKEDMLKPLEKYYNTVSKQKVTAKQITGTFTILNGQGDEWYGNPNDWYVQEDSPDSMHRACWPEVFKANYIKLPVLGLTDEFIVADDLGTECREFKVEYGNTVMNCAVCGEVVEEGWICQHDAYHKRCVAWKLNIL